MTMGRTMMYRDDFDKQDMLEYAYEIKKTACKIIEALEDDEEMQKRTRYRDMHYRGDDMDYRRGRYSY